MKDKGKRSFDNLRTKPKVLVLIDSNAIIHRAYHAMPKSLTTRSGEQTNAVYGFATTLIKVLEDLKPDYIAASFDLEGPTFRHEAFKEYKATRVKADQELYDQIPRVKEMLTTMNVPIYEHQGFEADDCLGTIVAKISKSKVQISNEIQNPKFKKSNKANETNEANKLDIYIVSGDKDIFQLINGDVKVYNLRRGLSDTQIVDREIIEKEYHLQPKDFIDLKALAGDASDNIPGVPGIGAKTATTLLQDFDTLEKLYKKIESGIRYPHSAKATRGRQLSGNKNHDTLYEIRDTGLKKIKPRILQLLIENKDQAFLSQKLATIDQDVPVEFRLDDARWGEYDKGKLKDFFEELGFRSLLRRFGIIEESPDRKPTEEQKKKDDQLRLL